MHFYRAVTISTHFFGGTSMAMKLRNFFRRWNARLAYDPSLMDFGSYSIARWIRLAFFLYLLIPVWRSCIFFIFWEITFTTLKSYNTLWTNLTIVAHDIWRRLCVWYKADILEWFWNMFGAWKPIVQVALKGMAAYVGARLLLTFQADD